MTDKEKVIAYDKVVNKLSKFIQQGVEPLITKNDVQDFFPELAELNNEDERIRKAIIEFFELQDENTTYSLIKRNDILAWLEKQANYKSSEEVFQSDKKFNPCDECINHKGCINCNNGDLRETQQKTTDKIEPKFKNGYWIFSSILGTAHIIGMNNFNYKLEYIDGKQEFSSIDYIDYAYDEWTIDNAKDGDVLATSNQVFIYRAINHNTIMMYTNMSLIDNVNISDPIFSLEVTPATKEQRELLFKKIKENGYEWDSKKKELKKIEEKPQLKKGNITWNEEDEKMLNHIIGLLKGLPNLHNWLKSLKDRIQLQQKVTWNENDKKKLESIINKSYYNCCLKNNDISFLKSIKQKMEE